ncbi:molecular chaperone [Pluralibacter sp.]|jgi:P pilus assembly chaperone PapD|uniref:fimbrial biogenesis chaperone n=1 Tax=Pluralibacter sp. TaxID=1920032 RepID=UPI0025FF074D|nr:fimbria/pilus periplasmic chaperone [Pluralibacter sp.]MBV8043469.1 fimbria/pilus periplasmic chaperone [Pluralibacter sp.]
MRYGLLLTPLLLAAATAHAGVIIGGTRLVYHGEKKEASVGITNPDSLDYLIQSWTDNSENSTTKPPFLVTPPLFRLDAHQQNTLRVVHTGGNLPTDRESLYWLNIKAIPSSTRQAGINTLQIAIKTRIKLIFRPQTVKGKPEESANMLEWRQQGQTLVVNNPTPFYMNFQTVTVNGKKISGVTWAKPKGDTQFTLPATVSGNTVSWSVITDYGSISKTWSKPLH